MPTLLMNGTQPALPAPATVPASTVLALADLEKKYDTQFKIVFDAIRELMRPAEGKQKRIGFRAD